jgi:hypothetical protein
MTGQEMLQPLLADLERWVKSVAPTASWTLDLPLAKDITSVGSASTFLLEMMPASLPSTGRKPPLRWMLRFLVTGWASDPLAAHALLTELAFSAAARTGWQVEQEPVSLSVWAAFGVAPRPSFLVRVPLELVQEEGPSAPKARTLSMSGGTLVALRGVLFGADDVPLSGGSVELPALNLRTETNAGGEFCLKGVPGSIVNTLRVMAKGSSLAVECRANDYATSPLILRMGTTEG